MQMKMLKQFEDVVDSPHVSDIEETKRLWLADFIMWTTKHCGENFAKQNADQRECGADMTFSDGSTCTGEWLRNTIGLSNKDFFIDGKDECKPLEGGICRPVSHMHYEDLAALQANGLYDPSIDDDDTSYCPVFRSGTTEKLKFCVERWREMTGGGGNLVLEDGTDSESSTCPGEFLTDARSQAPYHYLKAQ